MSLIAGTITDLSQALSKVNIIKPNSRIKPLCFDFGFVIIMKFSFIVSIKKFLIAVNININSKIKVKNYIFQININQFKNHLISHILIKSTKCSFIKFTRICSFNYLVWKYCFKFKLITHLLLQKKNKSNLCIKILLKNDETKKCAFNHICNFDDKFYCPKLLSIKDCSEYFL